MLNRKSVELLAPAGNFETFVAAIESGADAVYCGGRHFNMRVHNLQAFNFTNEELKAAAEYAHKCDKKIYITLNNLISPEEIAPLIDYLKILDAEIKPDALIVQDFAVINLIRKLGLNLEVHASVMQNVHNTPYIFALKNLGVSRVVVGRELSLNEVALLKQKTGMQIEYFVHGDMCIAVSGQCVHSGVTFGQSGNRGRCLKPCRWAYKFIDEVTGEVLDDSSYKLAVGDMCMLRKIPEMIQAGVYSFKIEGRMRPKEFVSRIVAAYRKAIDGYIADPTGYSFDETDWQDFYQNRVRKFTYVQAFGKLTKADIGLSGKHEPRFFSQAVIEKSFDDSSAANNFNAVEKISKSNCEKLNVRVSSLESAKSAVENGADLIYIGGEVFRPQKPFTLEEIKSAVEIAHTANVKAVLNTPRVTTDKILAELDLQLEKLQNVQLDGILVSNLGALNFVKKFNLPIYADLSFNLFNHEAAEFLQKQGAIQATASIELAFAQLRNLTEKSDLPIEILIHGATESMICDHNFIQFYHPDFNEFATADILDKHFALQDSAGENHSLRYDQFEQTHIYFAKDLCLLPYIEKFAGAAALRIDAQDYSPEVTGLTTKIYRAALDGKNFDSDFETLQKISRRKFGCGVHHFKESKNS